MININKYFSEIFILGIQELLTLYDIDQSNSPVLWKELDITMSARSDYQCNGMIRFFQILKQLVLSPSTEINFDQMVHQYIDYVIHIDKSDRGLGAIDQLESCKNFINISVNQDFITELFWRHGIDIFNNGLTNTNPLNKKRILIDYSSPNVAKSLHIGHLRSTIIGEATKRLMMSQGHEVIGINHIGDWGTQFGMIINFLKTKFKNENPESIIEYISRTDSNELMNIYREGKKLFDSDPMFSDSSREQTFMLQQGDEFNTKIWKKICEISSSEYNKIYKILNVNDLIERGESFYQPFIPNVLQKLKSANLLQEHNGAQIIMLNHWSYPLIVIKSDGGYTYDTTDLCALYHRLCIIDMDHIIYVTDVGQKSHFDMCFEIAGLMGWCEKEGCEKKTLTHIGFGLVLGKDGKKLKTRSGDVVKMLDVIDEITQKSIKCVETRARSGTPESVYYHGMTKDTMDSLSQKIGMNTLKYFDFTHTPESNYKYDPELMFSFNGNTGVYQMYSYARINGIIEKSSCHIDRKSVNQCTELLTNVCDQVGGINPISKETKKLIIHCIGLHSMLEDAVKSMDVNKIVKYLHTLCAHFNTFNSQKNGKIIGSPDELRGIGICLVVSRIIELLFNVLSLEPVDHI